jgi:hypothetical protein
LQVLEYLAHRLVTLYGVKKGRQEPNVKLHVLSQDIDPPLQSAFFPVSKLDRAVTQIVEGMELYLSSRQTLNLRHNFRIRVTIDRVPPISIRGGARGKAKKGSFIKFEASSKWSVTSRHVLVMPDIPAREPLADCCLLLALTVGMAYAKEKRDNPVRGNLVKRPVNPEWKHYRRLNTTGVRARRAEEYLKKSVSAAATRGPRRLAPNLAAFKTKSLDELVASGELDKFPANIFIYSQKANYRLLKQHPAVYDPTLPSIDILAVSLPDDKEEECEEEDEEQEADEQEVESRPASTESINDVRHAALITDEKAFMRKRKARLCRYCGKSFSFIHFNVHKCPAAARCSGCLRIKGVLNVDWKDRLNEKDLCFGPPDASPPRRDQERGGEARPSLVGRRERGERVERANREPPSRRRRRLGRANGRHRRRRRRRPTRRRGRPLARRVGALSSPLVERRACFAGTRGGARETDVHSLRNHLPPRRVSLLSRKRMQEAGSFHLSLMLRYCQKKRPQVSHAPKTNEMSPLQRVV